MVLSRGCRRDVSVLFQRCFSDVLVMFFCDVSVFVSVVCQ